MRPKSKRVRSSVQRHVGHYDPHPVAILGIDTAAISGYAVRIRGRLVASGEVDTLCPELVTKVVLSGVRYAAVSGGVLSLPLIVVFEQPWGGARNVVMALGAARERWDLTLRTLRISKRHVLSVQPNTWRSGLFGRRWVRAERAEIRAHEQAWAAAEVASLHKPPEWPDHQVNKSYQVELGTDEAAAICISKWAAHAPAVAELLTPAERRRRP